MTDPITTAGIAFVSKSLVEKLLGPTADYIGGELKEFTKRRIANINAMFANAAKKLGPRLDTPGQVPPRVLKTIVNDASYTDDIVSVEYFGGVLASARTPTGRDDRGARIARSIDGLSSYQIRAHYLIYSAVRARFFGGKNSFRDQENRNKMELFISFDGYINGMQFTTEEYSQILDHVMHGLENEGLISPRWGYGPKDELRKKGMKAPGDGIVCAPSAFGAEVLLWAFGHGDKPLDFLLTNSFPTSIEGIPTLGSEAIPTKSS